MSFPTRAVSAKQMTLVNPLQLLLFGCSRCVSDGEAVTMDNWIKLIVGHRLASR
jgi:hypothetical protein